MPDVRYLAQVLNNGSFRVRFVVSWKRIISNSYLATSKGWSSRAMTGSNVLYEETEGIVGSLGQSSTQHEVIPVCNGWIDETSSELCHNVDNLFDSLNKGERSENEQKREAGHKDKSFDRQWLTSVESLSVWRWACRVIYELPGFHKFGVADQYSDAQNRVLEKLGHTVFIFDDG